MEIANLSDRKEKSAENNCDIYGDLDDDGGNRTERRGEMDDLDAVLAPNETTKASDALQPGPAMQARQDERASTSAKVADVKFPEKGDEAKNGEESELPKASRVTDKEPEEKSCGNDSDSDSSHFDEEEEIPMEKKLDLTSKYFDPLAAVYSDLEEFRNFDPNAMPADNLDKLEADIKRESNPPKPKAKPKPETAQPLTREMISGAAFYRGDNDPNPRRNQIQRNVLTYMEGRLTSGCPMTFLAKAVDSRIRVKVTTRGAHRIRGFMVGFVVAFDKYWNLALVDVDETYSRKRHRKSMLDEATEKMADKLDLGSRRGHKSSRPRPLKATEKVERVGDSKIRILKCRRKTELCQRHVPQVILRGEHIVMIQSMK